MKYILITLLLLRITGHAQEWVQIRKAAVNGCEDMWVRKGSSQELSARLIPVHDTVYIDSFRNKIWAAWARLRQYSKPVDTIRYDTSIFVGFSKVYSYRSGFISNGHLSKKRHSIRARGSEWISGDYYYVIHDSWENAKSDTLGRFSSHDDALQFFFKKAHRYLSAEFNKASKGDRLILTLDEHELRIINLYSTSFESFQQ